MLGICGETTDPMAIYYFGFQCNCVRCCDASELGTYTSALICSKCKPKHEGEIGRGRILPIDVNKEDSEWKCESCDFQMKATVVAETVSRIKAESERLDADPKVGDPTD